MHSATGCITALRAGAHVLVGDARRILLLQSLELKEAAWRFIVFTSHANLGVQTTGDHSKQHKTCNFAPWFL